MNTFKFTLFFLCSLLFVAFALSSLNCSGTMAFSNIGDQPIWGPTGYDRADYYYIPDIDSYYSVSEHQYIYRNGSEWTHSASLPSTYSNYDPYHSYKVVVNQDKPYQYNENHRTTYGKFKGVKDQQVIRDSHDQKYFENKDHPEHDKWVRTHRN